MTRSSRATLPRQVTVDISETLDLSEFIVVELLRLGKVDRPILKQIVDFFKDMDTKSVGFVSKSNLIDRGLLLPPPDAVPNSDEVEVSA